MVLHKRYDMIVVFNALHSKSADEYSFDTEPDPLIGHVMRSMQEDPWHVFVDMCVVAGACFKLCSRCFG